MKIIPDLSLVIFMVKVLIKKVLSINLMFLLIFTGFISFLILEITIDEIKISAITVNDDGGANFINIQDAIDSANIGEIIYVWAGTYFENLIINKSVTLIGNGTINTTIDGGGIGDVVRISANWVNITGFTIINSGNNPYYDSGIELNNVENVTIYDNNCSNNKFGIYIFNSNLSIIEAD